jgi:hypothetical protein
MWLRIEKILTLSGRWLLTSGVYVTVDEVQVCTVLTGAAGDDLKVQWCEDVLGRSVQDMDVICASYRASMPSCLSADLATALKGARVSEERATGKKGWRFSKNTAHTDLASLVLAAGKAASERGRTAQHGSKCMQVLFDTCAACHLGDSDIARSLNRQPDKSKCLRVVGVDQIPKETQGECLLEVTQQTTDQNEVTIGVEAQIDDIGNKVILSAPGLIRDQNVIVVMGLDPVSKSWSSFLQFPNGQLVNLSLTKGGMTVLGADPTACAGGNVSAVSDPTEMVMEVLVRWQQRCRAAAGLPELTAVDARQAAADHVQDTVCAGQAGCTLADVLGWHTEDCEAQDGAEVPPLADVLAALVAEKIAKHTVAPGTDLRKVRSREVHGPRLDVQDCHDLLHGGEQQVRELVAAIIGKNLRGNDAALAGGCVVCQQTKMVAPYVRKTSKKQAVLVHVCEGCLENSARVIGNEEKVIELLADQDSAPDVDDRLGH